MQFNLFNDFLFHPKHQIKWQIIFWLNSLLLLFLTLTPSHIQPINMNNVDKLYHIIGFGAFAFFGFLAFRKLHPIVLFIISLSLGISVELIQAILPYRSFSYADMLADAIGIITAISFLYIIQKISISKA